MAGPDASESDGSFGDSQYDMIDDLSETSNDDHDTASIASHDGLSGQLTPEYAQSEADETEEHMVRPVLEHTETITMSPSAESFAALPSVIQNLQDDMAQLKYRMKAENDLIDSYTSEDLETPRQSTMTNAFASTYRLSQRKTASRSVQTVHDDPAINHILFVSDRDMSVDDVDVICARAALCLDPADPTGTSKYEVVRLPATPSGMQGPAKIMRGERGVSATFQHCIGAESREGNSYQLLIVDPDEEGSSIFTIGPNAKIDMSTPKLAIFHLDSFTHGMAWFDTAYTAMQALKVPILVIHESDFVADKPASISYGKGEAQLKLDAKHYMAMDRAELETSIAQLLGEDTAPIPSPSRIARPEAKTNGTGAGISTFTYFKSMLVLAISLLPMLILTLLSPLDPAADLAIRREAVSIAVDNFASSANITQTFDPARLVPAPPTNCTQSMILGMLPGFLPCHLQAYQQPLSPNHAIISLQNGPREPRTVSVEAYRHDNHTLRVIQTKLIPGVYHLAIDPNQAYGTVNFTMVTKSPDHNFTWSRNFGSRFLQRKTFARASTDISKTVSKDVAVMRHAAKGISEKVSTEIGAGIWATKNVTTQLALYVTRDIQLAANTAVSVFNNAAKASNKTASNLGKDLVLVQKGISTFGENVSRSIKSKVESARAISKAFVRAPVDMTKDRLALSRERIQRLKKALSRSSAKEPVVPKEDLVRSKFDSYLAATSEHELPAWQKPGLGPRLREKGASFLARSAKRRDSKGFAKK